MAVPGEPHEPYEVLAFDRDGKTTLLRQALMAEVVPVPASVARRLRAAQPRVDRDLVHARGRRPRDASPIRAGKILAPGGQIFFVVDGDAVLGTCAVMPHSAEVHEIAKMAVAPEARGRGYGDLLMDAASPFRAPPARARS